MDSGRMIEGRHGGDRALKQGLRITTGDNAGGTRASLRTTVSTKGQRWV